MRRHLSRRRSPTARLGEAHRGAARAQIPRRHPDPAPPPVFTAAACAIAGAPPPRPRRPAPVSSSALAAADPAPPAAGLASPRRPAPGTGPIWGAAAWIHFAPRRRLVPAARHHRRLPPACLASASSGVCIFIML
nr:atherin-like [Aegilops tauschii subsp. strangulata]